MYIVHTERVLAHGCRFMQHSPRACALRVLVWKPVLGFVLVLGLGLGLGNTLVSAQPPQTGNGVPTLGFIEPDAVQTNNTAPPGGIGSLGVPASTQVPGFCVAAMAGLTRRTWAPGNVSLSSTSPFTMGFPGGDITAYTRLGFRVSAHVAGPVGSCGSVVGTTPAPVGDKDVGGSTLPVPVAVVVDADPPATVYRITVGAWVPWLVHTVVLTQEDDPQDTADSLLNRMNDLATTPATAAGLAAWQNGAAAAKAAGRTDVLGPTDVMICGWEGGTFEDGNDLPSAAAPLDAHLTTLVNDEEFVAASRRVQQQQHHQLSETAIAPNTQHRQLNLDDIAAAYALVIATSVQITVANLMADVKKSRKRLNRLTEIDKQQDLILESMDREVVAIQGDIAANRRTTTRLVDVVKDLGTFYSELPNQVAELDTAMAYTAGNMSAIEQRNNARFEALVSTRNTVFGQLRANIATLNADLASAEVALAQHAASLNAEAWIRLDEAIAPLRAGADALRLQLARAQDNLQDSGAAIASVFDRNIGNQEAGALVAAGIGAVAAMPLGFRPVLGDPEEVLAAAPGPRGAWRAGSPLRAVVVDTMLHVQAVATVGGGNLLQTNVTVVCDPLALRHLTPFQLTAHRVMALWAAGSSGPCRVPPAYADMAPYPFMFSGSNATTSPAANANANLVPNENTTAFCVCWAVVDRVACPLNLNENPEQVFVSPGMTTGPPHPHTLTVNGIAGMSLADAAAFLDDSPAATIARTRAASKLPWVASPATLQPTAGPNATSSNPATVARFTACSLPPVGVRDAPWVVTHQAQLLALFDGLTCGPDPDEGTPGTWARGVVFNVDTAVLQGAQGPLGPGATTGLPVTAVMGSVSRSKDRGTAPYLVAVPLGNSRSYWDVATGGLAASAPQSLRVPTSGWPSWAPPLCSVEPGEALRLTTSGMWPNPAGLFLDSVGAGLVTALPLFRVAAYAASGRVPPGVALTRYPGQLSPDGQPRTVTKVTLAAVAGPWAAAGVAEVEQVWAAGRVAVSLPGADPPGTVYVSETTAGHAIAHLGALSILGSRYAWACAPVCATGPMGEWGAPECALPAGFGPPGPYVCDVPSANIVLRNDSVARIRSLTYAAFMGATRPPPLNNFSDPDPVFTTDTWAGRVEEGNIWDPTALGPSLAKFIQRLVPAETAGVTDRPFGVSDRVCEKDAGNTNNTNATGVFDGLDVGNLCFTLLHNVLYTAGPEGPDPQWTSGPLSQPDAPDRVVWVPRKWVLNLYDLTVPLGSVSVAEAAACPVVDTAVVNATGYPMLGLVNRGSVGLEAGAWGYTLTPVNATDPAGWAPGVSADDVAATCVPSGFVSGGALAPGSTQALPWLSTCSRWEVAVYLGEGTTPCWTPAQFSIKFGNTQDTNSSASDGDYYYTPGSSPGVLPLAFTRLEFNSSGRAANRVAATEAASEALASTLYAYRRVQIDLRASTLLMHGMGMGPTSAFGVALDRIRNDSLTGLSPLQADIRQSLAILGAPDNATQAFVDNLNRVGANDIAEAAAILRTDADFTSVLNAAIAALNASEANAQTLEDTMNTAVQEASAAVAAVNMTGIQQAFADANDTATMNRWNTKVALQVVADKAAAARKKNRDAMLSPWDLEVILLCSMVVTILELLRTRCCSVWRPLCSRNVNVRKFSRAPRRANAVSSTTLDTRTGAGFDTSSSGAPPGAGGGSGKQGPLYTAVDIKPPAGSSGTKAAPAATAGLVPASTPPKSTGAFGRGFFNKGFQKL